MLICAKITYQRTIDTLVAYYQCVQTTHRFLQCNPIQSRNLILKSRILVTIQDHIENPGSQVKIPDPNENPGS